jgi:hypothetical protein
MFPEDWMLTNIRESDSIIRIKIKNFLEKILNFRSTISKDLLLSRFGEGTIAEIFGDFTKLDFFSFWLPMRIEFFIDLNILKGNSILSMK